VRDRAAVEEIPGFTIGVDGPTADDACVKKIESLLAWPPDLPVWFSDQNGLALVDRDLVWTDLNLERHDMSLVCRRSGAA
jgi:hypothetical protein